MKYRHLPSNLTGPWTPEEFASLYRVSRATVFNWMARGWLRSVKIGAARRILPEHEHEFKSRFTAQGRKNEDIECRDRRHERCAQ